MFATVGEMGAGIDATEDPCPHGLPAWLCDADCESDCDDDPPHDPDTGPVVDLDQVPGARLALACQAAGAIPALLTDAEMLDVVEGAEKLLRWAEGLRTRMLAGFADRHPTGTSAAPPGADPTAVTPVSRWLPDEVGLTLGVPRLDALGEIARARRFTHVLPDTLDALEHGRIDRARADAIARATAVLPDDTARAVEATILPNAPDATLRQLRDRVRRVIARIDPDGQYRRHREARTERRVSIRSLDEGMASLWFYGPADRIEAAWQMADRLARALAPDDPRTLDQRRFDLAVQILQGKLTVTDMADVDTAVTSTVTAGTLNTDTLNTDTPDTPGHAAVPPTPDAGTTDAGTPDPGVDRPDVPPDPENDRPGSRQPGGGPSAGGPCGSGPCDGGMPDAGPPDAGDGRSGNRPPGGEPKPEPGPATPGARVPPEVLTDAVAHALAQRPDPHHTVHKPLIHVVVGLGTLLGDNQPAELVGHGPLDADTARALAAGGVWKRLVTDPLSGTLLDHGRTSYHPPAALADHVHARDQTCRGPQCTRRIRDLDHHHPWAHGGPTSEDNLHGLCRHHHQLKDAPGWHVLAHPDRSLTWISPHGRQHTTTPYDYRPFTDGHPGRCTSGPARDRDGVDPVPEPSRQVGPFAADRPAVGGRSVEGSAGEDVAPPF